jgi:hypothetical protein
VIYSLSTIFKAKWKSTLNLYVIKPAPKYTLFEGFAKQTKYVSTPGCCDLQLS